jgi:hypothetical protein
MLHPEIRDDGSIVGVFDFAFDLRPTKEGINLEAVKDFIIGLYRDYHISVVGVSSDRYQSKFIEQAVKKDKIEYRLISVDTDKTVYTVFKSKVLNGNVKVGYYENIKNNLKSLVETKDKVDHTVSRRGVDKDKDVGINAKDVSDGMAGGIFNLYESIGMHTIRYNYDDITRQLEMIKRFKERGFETTQAEKSFLYENLMKNIVNRNVSQKEKTTSDIPV